MINTIECKLVLSYRRPVGINLWQKQQQQQIASVLVIIIIKWTDNSTRSTYCKSGIDAMPSISDTLALCAYHVSMGLGYLRNWQASHITVESPITIHQVSWIRIWAPARPADSVISGVDGIDLGRQGDSMETPLSSISGGFRFQD